MEKSFRIFFEKLNNGRETREESVEKFYRAGNIRSETHVLASGESGEKRNKAEAGRENEECRSGK